MKLVNKGASHLHILRRLCELCMGVVKSAETIAVLVLFHFQGIEFLELADMNKYKGIHFLNNLFIK